MVEGRVSRLDAFCVKDERGAILARGEVATDPRTIFEALMVSQSNHEGRTIQSETVLRRATGATVRSHPAPHGDEWRSLPLAAEGGGRNGVNEPEET